MKKIYLLVLIVGLSNFFFSQENKEYINFTFVFGDEKLELNKEFYTHNDSIRFETIRFYLSNIRLHQENKEQSFLIKKHHLIDLENPETFNIPLPNDKQDNWDEISFDIGIDSSTNSSGAMGGDLDPTNGMYWTWQSGYINTKIEGVSTKCTARKKYFQFHIGGYQKPFQSIANVKLDLISQESVVIDFGLLFSEIDLQYNHTIMSPGVKAVKFSKLFSSTFKTVR